MVVCQFFLQGRCKFGAKCKFEHPLGGAQQNQLAGQGQSGGSYRVNFKDSFGTSGQASSNQYKWTGSQQTNQVSNGNSPSTLELVNQMQKEVNTWEKSKMWPFSCVGIEKDLPCLPDFLDVSPEELRLEAYQAISAGNVQVYAEKIQSLQKEYQNKRMQLQHMTMDVKSKLVSIIDEARKKHADPVKQSAFTSSSPQSSVSSPASTFGGLFSSKSAGSSTFGQSGSSSFGNSAGAVGSVFGNQQGASTSATLNPFASLIKNSSLGATDMSSQSAQTQPQPGLFGQTPTNQTGLFGNASTNQVGLFGKATTNQTGLFGKALPNQIQPQTSPFGQAANQGQSPNSAPFGQTGQAPNIFSTPVASPAQGLFGKQAPALDQQSSGSIFPFSSATPTSHSSVFGGSFNQNQSTSLFGKSVPVNAAAPGLFGNAPAHQGLTVGAGQPTFVASAPQLSSFHGHYTPLAELTQPEKDAFAAKDFELGRIPIRPPPREMI